MYWYFRYALDIFKAGKIMIVYTPGHVGSSTVFASLKAREHELGYLVLDIHSVKEKYNNKNNVFSFSARHVLQEVIDFFRRYKFFGKKVKLVSIMRDPIARATGGFFQSGWHRIGIRGDQILKAPDIAEMMLSVKRGSYTNYLEETLSWQINFYVKEAVECWSITFNEENSMKLTNYSLFKGQWCDMVMFKLETLNDGLIEWTRDQFQIDINVIIKNTSDQRFKNDKEKIMYQNIKNEIKLPETYLNKIYRHKIFGLCYSQDEIEVFKKRWIKA